MTLPDTTFASKGSRRLPIEQYSVIMKLPCMSSGKFVCLVQAETNSAARSGAGKTGRLHAQERNRDKTVRSQSNTAYLFSKPSPNCGSQQNQYPTIDPKSIRLARRITGIPRGEVLVQNMSQDPPISALHTVLHSRRKRKPRKGYNPTRQRGPAERGALAGPNPQRHDARPVGKRARGTSKQRRDGPLPERGSETYTGTRKGETLPDGGHRERRQDRVTNPTPAGTSQPRRGQGG